MYPRQLVDELHGVVVVGERPIVRVTDGSKPSAIEYHVGNAPRDFGARILIRNTDLRNYIQRSRAQRAE
jgi:hypothetical protein